MQHQPTPMSVAEQDAQTDSAILEVLLDDDAQRPWSEHEIALVLDDPIAASDGLGRLFRAGLIHRLDGFVFASRAALHAAELAQ